MHPAVNIKVGKGLRYCKKIWNLKDNYEFWLFIEFIGGERKEISGVFIFSVFRLQSFREAPKSVLNARGNYFDFESLVKLSDVLIGAERNCWLI